MWRNRRLLDTEADGLKPGDITLLPNLPEQGTWVLARVVGPYSFSMTTDAHDRGADYGHIVEVEPIRDQNGNIAVVEADNANVDARLRASMRNMSRMWSIDTLAPAVDKLIKAVEQGKDTKSSEPETEKAESFFAAMRSAAWENIRAKYKGAEFEDLVRLLFERIYSDGRVEHWGGPGEKGADLIVFTQDPLGLDFKIEVQVKLHGGVHDDIHALEQSLTASANTPFHRRWAPFTTKAPDLGSSASPTSPRERAPRSSGGSRPQARVPASRR